MEGRRLDWTLRLAKTRGGEEEEEAAPSAEAPGGGVFSAAKQRWAVSIHVNLGDPHGQNGKAEGEGGRERRKVEAGLNDGQKRVHKQKSYYQRHNKWLTTAKSILGRDIVSLLLITFPHTNAHLSLLPPAFSDLRLLLGRLFFLHYP